LKTAQGLRLLVFVKILARDMRPFEKSFLSKIGLPPMRRNWLFDNNLFKACSRDKTDLTDRLHQTSKPLFSIEIRKTARQVSSTEIAMHEKITTVIFQKKGEYMLLRANVIFRIFFFKTQYVTHRSLSE